jgi:hypothetical protein
LFAADFLEHRSFGGSVFEEVGDSKLSDRAGKPWSTDEDSQLREGFYKHEDLPILASRHKRSRGAIVARLVHLGLVDDRNEARKILAQRRESGKTLEFNSKKYKE